MRISSIHECNLVRLICKLDFSHILTRNNTFTLSFHLCLTERKKFDLNFSRLWYLIWSQKILSQKWRAKVTNLIMTTFFSLVSKIFKKSRRLYCTQFNRFSFTTKQRQYTHIPAWGKHCDSNLRVSMTKPSMNGLQIQDT